ncbi:MAG: hypothetical protein AAGI54_10045 [Planctomycetota bacterium]
MLIAIRRLDAILRGEATRPADLDSGDLRIPLGGIALVNVGLAAIYGVCMGSYAVFRGGDDAWMQVIASGVKMPMLFGLTLLITLPSLYVFSALAGSSLKLSSVVKLLVAMLGVCLAVLASLGPIVAFFGVSAGDTVQSYQFMKLLNVIMCGVAGVLGLGFLLRTLNRMIAIEMYKQDEADRAEALERGESEVIDDEPAGVSDAAPGSAEQDTEPGGVHAEPGVRARAFAQRRDGPGDVPAYAGALDSMGQPTDRRAARVYRVWVVVFAVVGMQMSWVLRPFIGHPDMPFTWFRDREANFFFDVVRMLQTLLGISGE